MVGPLSSTNIAVGRSRIIVLRPGALGRSGFQLLHVYKGAYKEITCSMLPYDYVNLPLPFIWGNFYSNFARFYYKKPPYIVVKLLP